MNFKRIIFLSDLLSIVSVITSAIFAFSYI